MKNAHETILYGTAVALPGEDDLPMAVLLRGLSGTGKSDLAFRLIGEGAVLISDDQVRFIRRDDRIFAEGVEPIRGMIEVRGVGLLRTETAPTARLRLVVDLVPRSEVPRLPENETADILGLALPRLRLHGFDASTPLKVRTALRVLSNPELLVT